MDPGLKDRPDFLLTAHVFFCVSIQLSLDTRHDLPKKLGSLYGDMFAAYCDQIFVALRTVCCVSRVACVQSFFFAGGPGVSVGDLHPGPRQFSCGFVDGTSGFVRVPSATVIGIELIKQRLRVV